MIELRSGHGITVASRRGKIVAAEEWCLFSLEACSGWTERCPLQGACSEVDQSRSDVTRFG